MNDSRSEYTTSHFKTSYPQNFNAEIVDLSKNSKFFSRNTRPFFRVDHQVQNNPQSTVTVKDSYLRPPTPPPKENEEVEKSKAVGDNDLKPSSIVFFASNSTFHGISHFVNSGPFTIRKLFWAAAFFCSLSGLLTQVYDRYIYYQSRPHVTKLDEEEASEISFPAVTLCNMNPFRLSAVTTDDYYYTGRSLLELFNYDFSLKEGFRDNGTWSFVFQKISSIVSQGIYYRAASRRFNMFEFYNRTAHTRSGIVKMCKYRGEKCDSRQWIPTYTRYGKCYTFNSGKNMEPLKTLKGGVDNGLELLLDTEQDEYMPVWDETDEISVEAGFKVQIHVQEEPPFIHELGFGISPGFQTLVATQEQRVTFLPEPYGSCETGNNDSKHFHYKNYSISACRITCETEYVVKKCDCRMIHMPGNAPYCTPEEYKSCADKWLDWLVNGDEKECVCGTPCEVTRYNLEMSTLQLPSTQAVGYLASKYNKTEEYVRNNFAKLNVFFEALNYETIDQKKAYELPGLFGDIGGQMGLFIGASLLTILELFDYVYEVIKDKIWGRKARKEKNQHLPTDASRIEDDTEIEGMQEYDQQHLSPFDPRSNDRKSHNSYLSPLPEYSSLRKRPGDGYISQASSEVNTRLPLHLRSSYATERPDEKKAEPTFSYKPQAAFHHLSGGGRKEMSVSYNDLYRNSGSSWANEDSTTSLNRPQMSSSAIGYTLPLSPVSSGKYFRPAQEEGIFMTSDYPPKQYAAQQKSPTRTIVSDFPDFPTTKETEIH